MDSKERICVKYLFKAPILSAMRSFACSSFKKIFNFFGGIVLSDEGRSLCFFSCKKIEKNDINVIYLYNHYQWSTRVTSLWKKTKQCLYLFSFNQTSKTNVFFTCFKSFLSKKMSSENSILFQMNFSQNWRF